MSLTDPPSLPPALPLFQAGPRPLPPSPACNATSPTPGAITNFHSRPTLRSPSCPGSSSRYVVSSFPPSFTPSFPRLPMQSLVPLSQPYQRSRIFSFSTSRASEFIVVPSLPSFFSFVILTLHFLLSISSRPFLPALPPSLPPRPSSPPVPAPRAKSPKAAGRPQGSRT